MSARMFPQNCKRRDMGYEAKTIEKLNPGERAVLAALLSGGRWTNVALSSRCCLNVNTAQKCLSAIEQYSNAETIPYKIESAFPDGGKLKEHWIVGKEKPVVKSKPQSCVCGVSTFFSTRNRCGSWTCSECGEVRVK